MTVVERLARLLGRRRERGRPHRGRREALRELAREAGSAHHHHVDARELLAVDLAHPLAGRRARGPWRRRRPPARPRRARAPSRRAIEPPPSSRRARRSPRRGPPPRARSVRGAPRRRGGARGAAGACARRASPRRRRGRARSPTARWGGRPGPHASRTPSPSRRRRRPSPEPRAHDSRGPGGPATSATLRVDMSAPRYLQVDDYEPVAKAKLDADVYDYYAGGAGDERTLEENLRAFDRWVIRPRVLRGSALPGHLDRDPRHARSRRPCSSRRGRTRGGRIPDGERATVRGAARAGTIAVVSSTAVDDLEGIAAASDGPKWWQLYLFAEPGTIGGHARAGRGVGLRGDLLDRGLPRGRACAIATRGAGSRCRSATTTRPTTSTSRT